MEKSLVVPELAENVHSADVAEVAIKPGDVIVPGQVVVTLETDKAAMDLPAEFGGTVLSVNVRAGTKVNVGETLAVITVAETSPQAAPVAPPAGAAESPPKKAPADAAPASPPASEQAPAQVQAKPAQADPEVEPQPAPQTAGGGGHASPGVRRHARELGVDLDGVPGTGRKGRVTEQDVHRHVRATLASGGSGAAALPEVDFTQWGEVQEVPLSRVRQLTGENLGRSWPRVPQVTQHDRADITDLEAFRKAAAARAEARGAKLTPVAFILKACASALRAHPDFNASLHPDGARLIRKNYVHIGVAVDTPAGLVVPVLRDVDRKSVLDLAAELGDLSARARERKLKVEEMRGGCFTISSLGGIGGTAFTPVVNWPEVAILGVSRASLEPVWQDGAFVARLMLPLSLSYDHRVIDGAAAARFTRHLALFLEDLRELLL